MAVPDTLQALLRQFVGFGDAPAVIAYESGGKSETLSFAALVASAESLARALRRRGLERGGGVAIVAANSLAWIIAYWAIIAAGGIAVPIDVQTGDDDLARMLAAARCRFVFAPASRALTPPAGSTVIAIDAALPQATEPAALPTVAADDIAVILFTSGTTGTPKGVPLTHANILSNVDAIVATRLVTRRDRALLPLPLHHAYPLTVGLTTAFANGVTLVLPAGVSGPELMGALVDGQASVLLGVPRLYNALVAGIRSQVAARGGVAASLFARLLALAIRLRPLLGGGVGRFLFRPIRRRLAPRLRLLVSGGAALDRAVEDALWGLGFAVMTGYGLTETSPILAFNRPSAARSGTAGRALRGVELRIARPDADGIGEIEARGASVFKGYLDNETASRAAFTGDGWLRTGDLGRIDGDGYLHIAARVVETIVLADGKKLFPEAIETVYAAHPLIREIALFAENGALVGLVVPDLDAVREAGTVRMRDLIRDALAAQARTLPSHARLSGFAIARERLPRTQIGKIRRHLVPELYARARAEPSAQPAATLSPEDRALLDEPAAAAAWAWLGRRFERPLDLDMSPQLDLGVESLGWVELTLAIERDLGVSLTEQEIARIVTLRDLLKEIVAASARPRAAPAAVADLAIIAPLGLAHRLLRHVVEIAMRIGMRTAFRLRVAGRENLPATGPFLICPNHASYLDPPAVATALPHALLTGTYWAGWTGILYAGRFMRLLSKVMQVVPVDVDRGAAISINLGRAVLARGQILAWFPEGALSPDGTLQRFLPGVGVVAEQHPVPIVPVLVEGSFACWPIGRHFPARFAPISVRFLPPLDPHPLLGAGPQAVADAVRDAIAAARSGAHKAA